jgi:nucleotide-binding universal stress UspA family protein
MKRILVGTDGSPSSADATTFGVQLAVEHGSELIFVHVIRAIDVVLSGMGCLGGAVFHEATAAERALLEDAAAVAAEHGVVATTALLRGNNTVDEIVGFADSHDVDLIVVGSRGRGSIANALLGSVARGVLSESARPVLVVRGAPVAPRPAAVGLGM